MAGPLPLAENTRLLLLPLRHTIVAVGGGVGVIPKPAAEVLHRGAQRPANPVSCSAATSDAAISPGST